jgi:hypothetical protein
MPMRRPFLLSLLTLMVGGLLLSAQDDGALRSGPKEGKFLPAAFDCYNFNGPHKGHFHCLVCRYALSPAVLIFAREPEEGKGAALNTLLKRLDDAVVENKKQEFHVAVVFLSPDAQSAVTNPNEEDAAKLVEEARKRDELYARMAARAEKLKGVDVGVFPAGGPKGYDLNPKAEVTVLLYTKMRVVQNRAYAPGALNDEAIDRILGSVKELVEPTKKKG